MGRQFGNLQKLKGIVYYTLSPIELQPFKGVLNPGLKNTFRRVKEKLLFMTIPAIVCYSVYNYVENGYAQSLRKNPDDFKDEE